AARFLSNNGAGAVESFKARHRIQPGWLHILHVGSNDPRKNLGTVFRVVAALKQKHKKDVCLVKVGAAFGPRETQAIQTMGLQEAVRHLGELSDEEIAHVYRACDVLLYPSFHEGMGRPVAEAMASGTPVVASNRGAIPEVVQHPNSLFDPEDVDGMTNQILQITASKDLRRELVRRGHEVAIYTTNLDGDRLLDVPLGQPIFEKGVEIRYFPGWIQPREYKLSLPLWRALREKTQSFDLAHIYSVYGFPTAAA